MSSATGVARDVSTRAELLALQRDEVRRLRKRYLGVWWRLPLGLLSLVCWFSVFGATEGGFPVGVGVGATVVFAIAVAARSALTLSSRRALAQWAEVDRTASARALPAGDIPEELLTVWDVREQSVERIAEVTGRQWAGISAQGRELRIVIVPVFPLAASLFAAIALSATLKSAADWPLALELSVIGTEVLFILMGPAAAWRSVAEPLRVQRAYEAVLLEGEALMIRRQLLDAPGTPDAAAAGDGEVPAVGAVTATGRSVRVLVAVALAGTLAWRVVVAPTSVVTVTVGVVLVFVVLPLVVLWRRAGEVRVALAGAGGALLGEDLGERGVTWEDVSSQSSQSSQSSRRIRVSPGNGAEPVVLEGDRLLAVRGLASAGRMLAEAVVLVGREDVVVLTGSDLPAPDAASGAASVAGSGAGLEAESFE